LGGAVKAMPDDVRLIVISDEQSSTPVPQRKKGYMINVASNQHGVGYGQWLHIDGWSDKVLDYILRYGHVTNDAKAA
jgi:60 kDa SS-A/Ro ribonucleoprotein